MLVFWTDEADFLQNGGDSACTSLPEYIERLLFLIVSVSFNILLDAHPKQVSYLAYCTVIVLSVLIVWK